MTPFPTLNFILSDDSCAGYGLPHLLAVHASKDTTGGNVSALELFFSTEKIRIKGANLEHLLPAILDGTATAPEHLAKPTAYTLTRIDRVPYKGWVDEAAEPARKSAS